MTERLLTSRELGEALGFSTAWVQDQFEADRLPGFRISGRLRFCQSEVEAWLEQHRRGPQPDFLRQAISDPPPGIREKNCANPHGKPKGLVGDVLS